MQDIQSWLAELDLKKFASAFVEAEVRFADLAKLTDEDLKELGLPVGPRRRASSAIKAMNAPHASVTAGASIEPIEDPQPEDQSGLHSDAERRHLTVMFVDLVGSTEMATRIDAEDMRNVITGYQNTVAGVVGRHEGFVAKFMGDGVLCYFGWPRANEDDAEHAVRAGLSIIDTVRVTAAPDGTQLATRIGIASGVVIVGDLIGSGSTQEAAVVGETPNLAARLQSVAEPNQLVLPKETQRLLGSTYKLRSIGAPDLKGVAAPIEAFVVEGETSIESRFAARHAGTLAPIVGRDREIDLVLERWSLTCSGQGQMIIVSGEAGIGKSRITQAVINKFAKGDQTRMICQCSPYYTDSAFHSVIQHMSFAAGFASSDKLDVRLDKLEALVGKDQDTLKLIASMMGLDGARRYGDLDLTPPQQRAQTMQTLIRLLVQRAQDKPVLLVYEDLHWIDPTSLEFLDLLLDAIADQQIMILATARPTFEYGFGGHPTMTRFALNRLGKDQIGAIVSKMTNGKALPDEIMEIIAHRTDGVPLFVEELTKTILQSGALKDGGDRLVLNGSLSTIAIPATLHDSLMARLDRLQPIKELAQTAACIGREFSHGLLTQILPLSKSELGTALDGLIDAELIYRRGVPPEATYLFKHALVRDAAYESLLKEKRRAIHSRIGRALEVELNSHISAEPEALAHHFTEAEMPARAIPLWLRAASQSTKHSADREAAKHLRKALAMLAKQPDDPDQRRLKLDALIALSSAIMNTNGSGSPEVLETLLRAKTLSDKIGDAALSFPVTWSLWMNSTVSGRMAEAQHLADQTLILARETGNPEFLLQAHHAAWTVKESHGDFRAVEHHASEGWKLYDPVLHAQHVYHYGGHDPGACAGFHLALSKWFLGYPETSRAHGRAALELVRAQGHPYTIAVTLLYLAITELLARDAEKALDYIKELIAFSETENLQIWLLNGRTLRCWALSELGRQNEVIDEFRSVIEEREETGSRLRQPVYLGAFAHALFLGGDLEGAEATIQRARSLAAETGEHTWDACLIWIDAEIVRAKGPEHTAEAAKLYHKAIAIADSQSARSISLRAATGLVTLLPGDNASMATLSEIYSTFIEGFDTPDLREARAALNV